MKKIPFQIIKQHFDSVNIFRWAIYGYINRNNPFVLSDVRERCFDKSFSRKRILELIRPVTKNTIENNIIISNYSVKQYSYCDYEKLMHLKYPAAKLYMCAQCNMLLHKSTIFQYCNCSDLRTVFSSLERAGINYNYNRGLFLLHQDGYTLEEKLKYISEKNIEFLKRGSAKIIINPIFWEAQRCFGRCGGNCGVTSYKQATTKSKLKGRTIIDYVSQESPCAYCRKFPNSPAAKWLQPIWEKYPVKNVKEMV